MSKPCSVDGCDVPSVAKGLCNKHWRKQHYTLEHMRLYWIWADMRGRCSNQKHKAFKNYGGRGIRVCERWLIFANFIADMGPRHDGMTLDRRDNDGDYTPNNCRWATRYEQSGNRRNCIYVQYQGDTLNLKEASRRAGLVYKAVYKRIVHRGWDVTRALSTPIGIGNTHATTQR